MKNPNRVAQALFLVCLWVAPLATASAGTVEEEVSVLSDQMIQANLKGDVDFYQAYYADDATIVHGNGKLVTKEQDIADLKAGVLKYESIDVREKTVRAYGDTGVVHLLITFKGTLNGQAFPPVNLHRTVVWVKQKGAWKVVAWQVTRVPDAK
ncbi:nuclear transport factor 2 family protein [Niveibacterium sp. SC-1]|uniref:nuclear transport factor 2 family protein n=1 Tax=Niveibacterium sp. SC-1 TaxID=3135646 RepID=UPI00311E938E